MKKKTNGMSKRGMGIFRSIQNRTAKIPLENERKQKQKAEQIWVKRKAWRTNCKQKTLKCRNQR